MKSLIVLAGALTLLTAGCAAMQKGPVGNTAVPQPAKSVELERYLGRWYEIGRYEQAFQKNCEAVTADYSLRNDGKIDVVNSCHKDTMAEKLTTATGKAKVVEGGNGAKLKVSFFGPFYGDYWVLDHADDYSWSIVGEPSGRYLWLLHRNPQPGSEALADISRRASQMGYDMKLLRWTKQPPIR
jgi:apolipoprotein D and lipocalin family protein